MAGSLSVRKKNAAKARKRRFETQRATRSENQSRALDNLSALGSGIASIPGRVVNYIKTSTPSGVVGDVKNLATSVYDAATEDPGQFIGDTIFSPLAAVRDFGDVRAMARKLREQGRNDEAQKLEAMAGLSVLSAIPVVGKVTGTAIRDAEQAALRGAVREGVEAETRAATKAATKPKTTKAPAKQIPGAPQGVKTPAQEAAIRENYRQTVEKGKQGALWYDDSGKAIMSHTGENPDMARKVSGNFAVTSSSTGVKPNTGFTVKGHNQAISGDTINTGRFPTAMSAGIADVYNTNGVATGLKRGPFEQQLAIGGGFADPSIDPRAVHDIWDMRALQYPGKNGKPFEGSATAAQHRWMDDQLNQIIPTLSEQPFPWTTGRTQAAGWSGAKINSGEIQPGEAAYSYADDLPRHYAQGSRETVFGSNTGIMPELLDASYAARQDLDERVAETMYDQANRDRIALGFGALTGPHFQGPGIYEGINPGRQAQYAVGADTIKKGMESDYVPVGKAIDPSSMNLMKAIESTYGLLTGQKAVAGHRMFGDVPAASRNARELLFGQPVSNDQAQVMLDLQSRLGLNPDAMAIVPSPQGVRVANFGIDPDLFKKYIDAAASETGSAKPGAGFFHGMYEENPWDADAGRYGQSYLDIIGARPEYVSSFDKVAPELAARLRDTYRGFAKENQMTMPEYFDELLGAVAGGGEKELRDLIRKRGYAEGGAVDGVVSGLQELLEKYA